MNVLLPLNIYLFALQFIICSIWGIMVNSKLIVVLNRLYHKEIKMVAKELRQLYGVEQLLKGLDEETLVYWQKAFEKQRSENGTVITSNCPAEMKVGIKVYVHKDMRDTLNEYCTLSNTKLSDLIRELLINHLREQLP